MRGEGERAKFCGMGLCSSAAVLADNEEQLTLSIHKHFIAVDKNGNGRIDVSELGMLVEKGLGMKLSPLELKEAADEMDADGSGEISWPEFKRWFFTISDGKGKSNAPVDEESSPYSDDDDGDLAP